MSSLRAPLADFKAEGFTKENASARGAQQRFSSRTRKVDASGRIHVYISITDTADVTLDVLRRHGLDVEIVNNDFRTVQGWIPMEELEALAAEPTVLEIRPPSYGHTRAGSVDTQGDSIHRCDAARSQGWTGAGAKVGVVSGGVDGLASSQASGNLPAVQIVVPQSFSDDEGTAILEIVYDCAPGASLAFASDQGTSLGFIQAVNALREAGATVIVDDIGFYTEGYFEDGLVARNDRTVGATVLRVSAAGNDAQGHYQGTFVPGTFDAQIPGTRHNFGGGDTLLRAHVPAGTESTIILQWSNRFGSAGDDYDLCVRQLNGQILACSTLVQNGNDDPVESVDLDCPGTSTCSFDIQITLFSGAAQVLELYCFACILDEFGVPGDSIFGHPAVPEVLAVGAVPAGSPSAIESFSSRGPSTILFPATESRAKPDLVAVDGVSTSRPGFNPFLGTSAAAPHVAGVAALLIGCVPTLTSGQLRSMLTGAAVDLGTAGFDSAFGFGRVDALNAVSLFGGCGKAVITSPTPGTTFAGTTITFSWTAATGATEYWLDVGTTPAGLDLLHQSQGLNLTGTVSGLPTTGQTLYVRLWSLIAGAWQFNDYTYTACSSGCGGGGGSVKAQMQTPPPGSVLAGATVSFTWTAGSGATEYWLDVGTTQGGLDLLHLSQGTNLSGTVGGLPTTGQTVYVRLWSFIGGAWQFNDYTYTACSSGCGGGGGSVKAQMQTPPPGSVLPGATVSFTWSAGSGATEYWLDVGTTPAGLDLLHQSQGMNLSGTVSGLPTTGHAVYVRLWSLIAGAWQFNDYTYTAAGATCAPASKAQLLTPTPGSVLPGAAVTFTWSQGCQVVEYWLDVGTTQGGINVLHQSQGTNLSGTVNGLPTTGQTLYVRLWSFIGGVWQFNDYTFTAAAAVASLTMPVRPLPVALRDARAGPRSLSEHPSSESGSRAPPPWQASGQRL